jgi:hypothetical protein
MELISIYMIPDIGTMTIIHGVRMYKTIYTEVEVDVDLSDFDTDDLIEELESRVGGHGEFGDGKDILQTIYEKRRVGKDYQTELEQLIALLIQDVTQLEAQLTAMQNATTTQSVGIMGTATSTTITA